MSKAKWTLLIYIAAHNDLNENEEKREYGTETWQHILGMGSTRDVNTVVLLDTPRDAGLYYVDLQPNQAVDLKLGDFDSGDAGKLIDVAGRAFGQLPAERYGVILWSHGNGWTPDEIGRYADEELGSRALVPELTVKRSSPMPARRAVFTNAFRQILKVEPTKRAICFDDGSHHALDTLALESVAAGIHKAMGQKIDLLGMDACLMASAEVGYQLRNDVHYMVASEELVPATSWPYSEILKALFAAPGMAPGDLAACIVDEYLKSYAFPPQFGTGDVTQIALDLSKMESFAQKTKALADTLIAYMDTAKLCLKEAQNTTLTKETAKQRREESKFTYHLWDIYSVVSMLVQGCPVAAIQCAAKELCETFHTSGLVVREGHRGEWFDGTGGLSVYFIPPKKGRPRHISRFYKEVAFANDAGWNKLLEAYRL